MRDFIETQFACRVVQWAEPTDDLGGVTFSAVQRGRLIIADSLALLMAELQAGEGGSLVLPLAA